MAKARKQWRWRKLTMMETVEREEKPRKLRRTPTKVSRDGPARKIRTNLYSATLSGASLTCGRIVLSYQWREPGLTNQKGPEPAVSEALCWRMTEHVQPAARLNRSCTKLARVFPLIHLDLQRLSIPSLRLLYIILSESPCKVAWLRLRRSLQHTYSHFPHSSLSITPCHPLAYSFTHLRESLISKSDLASCLSI
jgi:hypothetical protein